MKIPLRGRARSYYVKFSGSASFAGSSTGSGENKIGAHGAQYLDRDNVDIYVGVDRPTVCCVILKEYTYFSFLLNC